MINIYRLFFIIVVSLFLSSCSLYKDVDVKTFNEYIKWSTVISSGEDVVTQYFEFLKYDIVSQVDISMKQEWKMKTITVINSWLRDDSIASEKYVFDVESSDQSWKVLRLRLSWKCHKWRWHTYWWSANCY
jgi:hypothetical protein